MSPSTVRNLWLKEGMETKYKRLLRLEEEKNGQDIELTAEQIRLIEKANPSFRERKVESLYPGYLLSQDTFLVGTLKGIGRIYMQAVVDTYGSFAFGKLYTSKLPERDPPSMFFMTVCCPSTRLRDSSWSTSSRTTAESTVAVP